ncbi:TRAP transporter small permease [Halarsenatibacter silvermanii]|nr:TRAP transporter small permease [Halarsenatibacter silvermanii]
MEKLLIILMIAMVGVVFANIVLRFVGRPIRWADEVARLVFVWIAFIGMYVGFRRKVHPSFTLLVKIINNKSTKAGKFFKLLIQLSIFFFLAIITYGGYLYIDQAWIQTTAVLRISVGWKYMAAPVGGILMLLEVLRNIMLLFTKEKAEFGQKMFK